MSSGDSLAVLIVAYRSAGLLEKCLVSVKKFLPGRDVHIWDNSGSGVPEVRELAAGYPEFHWHFSEENIGFGAAVNRLAATVPGRDLLLLNPDAELLSDLSGTLRELEGPGVAAAGPMLSESGSNSPDDVGLWHRQPTPWDIAYRKLTFVNALSGAAGLGERLRETPFSYKYRRQPHEVDGFIAGCCLAIRRQAWDSVGPFDEEFFLYQEEADWQRRAIAAGWKVMLADEVAVRHIGAGTVAGDSARSLRSSDLAFANSVLHMEYNFGTRAAEFYLVWWALFEGLRRRIRGKRPNIGHRPEVLVTAAGDPDVVAERAETALALDRAGYDVAVVSLQRLGMLQHALPPSVRLVRRPWWWPSLAPQQLPGLLVVGTTNKERAFGRVAGLLRRRAVVSPDDAIALPPKTER